MSPDKGRRTARRGACPVCPGIASPAAIAAGGNRLRHAAGGASRIEPCLQPRRWVFGGHERVVGGYSNASAENRLQGLAA